MLYSLHYLRYIFIYPSTRKLFKNGQLQFYHFTCIITLYKIDYNLRDNFLSKIKIIRHYDFCEALFFTLLHMKRYKHMIYIYT